MRQRLRVLLSVSCNSLGYRTTELHAVIKISISGEKIAELEDGQVEITETRCFQASFKQASILNMHI